jgi:hypothetical protein
MLGLYVRDDKLIILHLWIHIPVECDGGIYDGSLKIG